MLRADKIHETQKFINGEWVAARPVKNPLVKRIKDGIQVIKGKAEAVKFKYQ